MNNKEQEWEIAPPYIENDSEYEGGRTVQVVATHPFCPTKILWLLGKPETKPTNIRRFKNQPKPPAWQNPGGGMEEGEVEMFLKRFPDHPMVPFITDVSVSLYNRNIVCCGLRESIDESGYVGIEVYPYTYFYRFDRDNRDDDVSVYDFMHGNGHRVKTLFGHVTSFVNRDIVEKEEIERSEWIDLSLPLTLPFFDRVNFPLHPFLSHVRRLMIVMRRVRRMSLFDSAPEYCRRWTDITGQIHSSWKTVFPAYAGYPGFPEKGFRFNRDNWYRLFYEMVSRKMREADPDFIQNLFRADIIEAVRREEKQKARGEELVDARLNEYTAGRSFGHDNVPVDVLLKEDKEWQQDQDEEYARWYEESLPENQRLLSRPSA